MAEEKQKSELNIEDKLRELIKKEVSAHLKVRARAYLEKNSNICAYVGTHAEAYWDDVKFYSEEPNREIYLTGPIVADFF